MPKKVYVCFQAGDRGIMAITDTEKQAKEICNFPDDAYLELEMNKDYGRAPICTDYDAVYNMGTEFRKLEKDE